MEFFTSTIFVVSAITVAVLLVLFAVSYVKAPPSVAFIISGISRKPRVLIGKGGFKIPFLERLDRLYLGQISVDIKTDTSVPTNDFINVDVDAVAKIRIVPDTNGIQLAAANFLNMNPVQIANEVQDTLQGNMREIIGTLELKALNIDRDGFSDRVLESAVKDMSKLGIEILSCNIQNITDRENLIKDLGADNTAKIRKDAAINKAKADRDIDINIARAKEEANRERVDAETKIAEQNNDLALKQAELKKVSDTKKAEAAAAYHIQEQEQQKTINERTVDAQIAKTKREQILTEEQVKVRENVLAAEMQKTADAEKYRTETQAAAALEQEKRLAEAQRYNAEQKSLAMKAEADATRYQMEQEALGIKAQGDAEAYAIREKGNAEAAALEARALAYAKNVQATIAEKMIECMPLMAKEFAAPISAIDSVNIYGNDGSGISSITGQMPTMMKSMMDMFSSVTGVDMRDIIKSNTIAAKTDRNIVIEGSAPVSVDEKK